MRPSYVVGQRGDPAGGHRATRHRTPSRGSTGERAGSALGATLGVLVVALVLAGEAGGAHVDLGAHADPGRELLVVEVEDDPLALAQHAEDRAVQRLPRQ